MDDSEKTHIIKELRRIPGIGVAIAEDLWQLGIRCRDDLKQAAPEEWYQRLCVLQGCRVDRCMLYVFRCAQYYVEHDVHEPDKLKWWYWKDR